MTEDKKTCDNCIFVSLHDPDAMYGYSCICPHPKIFKTDKAEPNGYCIYHEPIKKEKKK